MSTIIAPTAELLGFAGHAFEPGPWVGIDQARITAFANCTEDFQYIHVDPVMAADGPFGVTIAHGLLVLSLLAPMCMESTLVPTDAAFALNYGFDKVRFLTPVRSGSRVRAHVRICDVSEKAGGRLLIKHLAEVEIEKESSLALSAEWLFMWLKL